MPDTTSRNTRITTLLASSLAFAIANLHAGPEWAWTGAVQPDTAVIKVGWSGEAKPLEISTGEDLANAGVFQPAEVKEAGPLGTMATYQATHMTPDTVYHYGVGGDLHVG